MFKSGQCTEGLPLLPGNTFKDPTLSSFHRSNTLSYKNGFQIPKAYPTQGIGGRPLKVNQLTESELAELANYQPTLTYGNTKPAPVAPFTPAYVALDHTMLRFYGYFKETVNESPQETYRVRKVVIHYFMVDDSMSISEPKQMNSGLPQGKLVQRHRFPKNEFGDTYHWKDLNLRTNLAVYGRVYRITNCDKFTKEFLESEGVVVKEPETEPNDPYLANRALREALPVNSTPSSFDKRRQYLELDRKVLRFSAVWDDREELYGECRKFTINYYLADDTMEVCENHTPNDGRDPFPILIRRSKIPKTLEKVPTTFPTISMELSQNEVKEYFSPKDLRIGKSVVILGRTFLIHDCDNFTKAWYYQNYGMTDFKPVDVELKKPEPVKPVLPPYNGLGTLEDSVASIRKFEMKAAKSDFPKQIDYMDQILRYETKLDSALPEDALRRFILTYRLSDDMITVHEIPSRNSGFSGGTFMSRVRVAKPGSNPETPEYYGPLDFYIGSRIDLFGHRMTITDVDVFVVDFMEKNPDKFPADLIECLRNHVNDQIKAKQLADNVGKRRGKCNTVKLERHDGDLNEMMHGIRDQLRKMSITDCNRTDNMFLRYNKDRLGFVDIESLKDMCRKIQLPADEDVLSALLDEYGTNGRMTLEQFRAFFDR